MVRRHNDQMIRTRNIRARDERIDTGVLVKNHNGRKVSFERKVGECYQRKETGQISNGDSCSSSHGNYLGQKAQTSPPSFLTECPFLSAGPEIN